MIFFVALNLVVSILLICWGWVCRLQVAEEASSSILLGLSSPVFLSCLG